MSAMASILITCLIFLVVSFFGIQLFVDSNKPPSIFTRALTITFLLSLVVAVISGVLMAWGF